LVVCPPTPTLVRTSGALDDMKYRPEDRYKELLRDRAGESTRCWLTRTVLKAICATGSDGAQLKFYEMSIDFGDLGRISNLKMAHGRNGRTL